MPIPGELHEHVEGFLADCELRGMSPGTVEGYRSNMRIWERFVRERGIEPDSGRDHLEAFLGWLRNG